MNIKHIQYMIEIERVGSISQAAKNLYVEQPNLSRILREVEETVGFAIFNRTHQGISPTERGKAFLQHAHNILREMNAIETMVSGYTEDNRLCVCIPHSTATFDMVSQYLIQMAQQRKINAVIRECHPKKTMEILAGGQAEIGVIRFREEYRQYFNELATASNLRFIILKSYKDVVLVHKDHPLSGRTILTQAELSNYLQISHSDQFFLPDTNGGKAVNSIYTIDRHAQLTLLRDLPGSYMWTAPVSEKLLLQWDMVQLPCEGNTNRYSEALLYNPSYLMSDLEKKFLEILKKEYAGK